MERQCHLRLPLLPPQAVSAACRQLQVLELPCDMPVGCLPSQCAGSSGGTGHSGLGLHVRLRVVSVALGIRQMHITVALGCALLAYLPQDQLMADGSGTGGWVA